MTGLGGRWGNKVYHLPVANQFKHLAITQLEMVNILVAVKLFAKEWQKKKICVKCDNMAVVQVLSSGRTKDPFLGACARNIWLIAATNDIDLGYVHFQGGSTHMQTIPSYENIYKIPYGVRLHKNY